MGKPRYFFPDHSQEADFEASLNVYHKNITAAQFAATLLEHLKKNGTSICDIHFLKSGAFGMIFKIFIRQKNKGENYFLKFYRNKSSLPEYTPEKMKNLCLREYMTLKTAHQNFSMDEEEIDVITPVSIIPDFACFITSACHGKNLQKYLCAKTKTYFLNPSNYANGRSFVVFLNWHIERIAKLFAKIHELELDYELFKERQPFHVLDFDYKKQKFLQALYKFDISTYQKANYVLGILTQKARDIFPALQSTGLATPDTNLTNFIISADKIYMMDFFLIQHGPCYQPIGKFIACLELILYYFVPQEVIIDLRKKFITTYRKYAQRHVLDQKALSFFINWNYMTFLPRYGSPWKHYYQKWIFKKKIALILKNWQDFLDQNR